VKHLRTISHQPSKAQETSIGAILSVVAQILSVIGAALVAKDAAG